MADLPVYISGVASKLGSRFIPANEICSFIQKKKPNLTDRRMKKLLALCGTSGIYRLSSKETLEEIATEVSEIAIKRAGIEISQITGIYPVQSPSGEYLFPEYGRRVADNLGIKNKPIIPASGGCIGTIEAMYVAAAQLRADDMDGICSNFLIICGDNPERVLDPYDETTIPLFSTEVSAIVITNQKIENGYQLTNIKTAAIEGNAFAMTLESPFNFRRNRSSFYDRHDHSLKYKMNGEGVYEFVIRDALNWAREKSGFQRLTQERFLIPHQPSWILLRQIANQEDLPEDPEKLRKFMYIDGILEYGNVSGSSFSHGLEDSLKKNYGSNQRILGWQFGIGLKSAIADLKNIGSPRQIAGIRDY